jgi:hypothetical protein
MIKKVFANSSKFWNWLVVSSVDPASVALSIQGVLSMAIVQTLFGLLPVIGIHPTFTLAMLSSGITSAIYTVATIVTSLVTLYGLFRKAIVSIHGLVPAPVSTAAAAARLIPSPMIQ